MTNKNRMKKVRQLVSRGTNSNAINDVLNTILPTLSTKDRESATQTIDKVIEKVPELLENKNKGSPVLNLIDSVVNSVKDSQDKSKKTTTPPPPPKPVNEPHVAARIDTPEKNTPKSNPIEQSPPPPEPKDPNQTGPPEVMSSTPESGDASNSYVSDSITPKIEPDNNDQTKTEDPVISENPQGTQDLKEEPTKEEPVKDMAKEKLVQPQETPEKVAPVKEVTLKEAPVKEASNQQEIKPVNKDITDLQSSLTDQTNNPSLTDTKGETPIQGYSQSIYSAQENQQTQLPIIQQTKPIIGPGEISAIIIILGLLISGMISFIILRTKKRQNVTKVLMFESSKPIINSKVKVENKVKTENFKKSRISIPPLMREFYGFPIPGYQKKSIVHSYVIKTPHVHNSFFWFIRSKIYPVFENLVLL